MKCPHGPGNPAEVTQNEQGKRQTLPEKTGTETKQRENSIYLGEQTSQSDGAQMC